MICPHCGAIMGKRYVAHYLTLPPQDEYVWHCRMCLTETPGGVDVWEDFDSSAIVGGDPALQAGAAVR
jgi:hypothetical protein